MEYKNLKSYEELTFTDFDNYLFCEGTNYNIYSKMGAHPCTKDGSSGVNFTLWAPNAKSVHILADFNGWNPDAAAMNKTPNNVWEAFIPGMKCGDTYKFAVEGYDGIIRYKADPYAFESELRPSNASVVCGLTQFDWHDDNYLESTCSDTVLTHPMAIYEVHLGSWKRDFRASRDGFLNYRQLADELAEYVTYMRFTHVELIGICEHPLDASWGYQVTGFYSPTKRYGRPDDFKYFIDKMHEHNIGVILDWVPAHFPKDAFGLESFDGTSLYEHEDKLRSEYPEWGTKAFNHGRGEVQSFLIGNAMYWINEFHIDALRVDAVAAMLYNSFSRSEWRPNIYGGAENLESIDFLRKLNHEVKSRTKGYLIAEDSSSMSGITSDTEGIALGFMFKWNMGWMNDSLKYIGKDPLYRKWHHDLITHISSYAFLENFILVLSHDEVVHLKRSLLEKFPGNAMDKIGALKTFYAYQFSFPGKKLLFMGQEFGMMREWSESREIDWYLANTSENRDVLLCVRNLLDIYKKYPVLHDDSVGPDSFEWINKSDSWRSTFSYIRKGKYDYNKAVLVILNFTPIAINDYTYGVPFDGYFKRIFSSYDSLSVGGSPEEIGDIPPLIPTKGECDGRPYTLSYNLRPYEAVIFEFP